MPRANPHNVAAVAARYNGRLILTASPAMEFFAVARVTTSEAALREALTIAALPRFCASIEQVIEAADAAGRIYTVWGEFTVHRETIRGGVRFTLPGCPNALAWTVTTGFAPAPEAIVVHCTINRTEHAPDFIETIEVFVDDWRRGLERLGASAAPAHA